jgi:hypothetical protein
VLLMEHMAEHLRQEGHEAATADLFMQHAQEAKHRANVVRQPVMQRSVCPPATAQADAPGADAEDTTP